MDLRGSSSSYKIFNERWAWSEHDVHIQNTRVKSTLSLAYTHPSQSDHHTHLGLGVPGVGHPARSKSGLFLGAQMGPLDLSKAKGGHESRSRGEKGGENSKRELRKGRERGNFHLDLRTEEYC